MVHAEQEAWSAAADAAYDAKYTRVAPAGPLVAPAAYAWMLVSTDAQVSYAQNS